jgi:putative phage-type endonuclease
MEPEQLQRTETWHQARLGKVTASRIADVVSRVKGGYGASRANYLSELVVERITGQPTKGYVSPAMVHGIDTEAEALNNYAFMCQADLSPVGFVPHPTIVMSGASPDSYVGTDGLVEIKCCQPAAHIARLRGGPVPEKYYLQVQWQLECTGRQWCDLVHYNPIFPGTMQLQVERLHRDDSRIMELAREVAGFLAEVDEAVRDLRSRYAA